MRLVAVLGPLLVCLGALAGGCGSAPPPPEWRSVELVALDRVSLRWSGPATGRVRLDFLTPDGRAAPQGASVLDLERGTPQGRELRSAVVALEPPLRAPASLRLSSVDGSPPVTVVFALDPGPLVEAALAPVDRLTGDRLAALLRSVVDARLAIERGAEGVWAEGALAARGTLALALAEAGLDAPVLAPLLPDLARGAPVDGALARRLMPLRWVETLLAPRDGLPAPWPPVGLLLGFDYEIGCVGRLEDGWVEAGNAVVGVHAPVAGKPGSTEWHTALFASDRLRAHMAVGGGGAAALVTSLAAEDPRAYVPSLKVSVDVNGPRWPPREARLVVQVSRWVHEAVLYVSVNGGPEAALLNAAGYTQAEVDYTSFETLRASLPVDPARLRRGQNEVFVRVADAPHAGMPMAMCVQTFKFLARFDEGGAP